jgi:hypothetical protein
MKNKLLITECEAAKNLEENASVLYKVHDNSTVFLLTHSSQVAQYVYEQLKLDYEKEKEAVSKA